MSLDTPIIPAASRRNHWMAQIATHAVNKPDAVAFRYLGADTTWGQLQDRVTSLAAALASIEDEENLQHKREVTIAGREYLRDEIDKIPGLKAFDSAGNFVLIDASALGQPSSEIVEAMIERGVFIRPMSPHHMKPGFVRITVGTPEQDVRFMSTLEAVLEEMGDA